jgi:hypothetical protein
MRQDVEPCAELGLRCQECAATQGHHGVTTTNLRGTTLSVSRRGAWAVGTPTSRRRILIGSAQGGGESGAAGQVEFAVGAV